MWMQVVTFKSEERVYNIYIFVFVYDSVMSRKQVEVEPSLCLTSAEWGSQVGAKDSLSLHTLFNLRPNRQTMNILYEVYLQVSSVLQHFNDS